MTRRAPVAPSAPEPEPPALRPGSPAGPAAAALVERYADRVYALALRLSGDRAEADDLTQEVFLLALRRWATFQGRAAAGTWLYTLALRLIRRAWRRRRRERARVIPASRLMPWGETTVMALAAAPADEASPARRAERDAALARVRGEIVRLPTHLRLPLVLKDITGLSVEQVAALLALEAATVKTRLHRARLALRKAMTAGATPAPAPDPIYDRQVCLDLLHAKLASMDRVTPDGLPAARALPPAELCARCRAVFRELDLVGDACAGLAAERMPPPLRAAIVTLIERDEQRRMPTRARPGRRPLTAAASTVRRAAPRAPARAARAATRRRAKPSPKPGPKPNP